MNKKITRVKDGFKVKTEAEKPKKQELVSLADAGFGGDYDVPSPIKKKSSFIGWWNWFFLTIIG